MNDSVRKNYGLPSVHTRVAVCASRSRCTAGILRNTDEEITETYNEIFAYTLAVLWCFNPKYVTLRPVAEHTNRKRYKHISNKNVAWARNRLGQKPQGCS
jgi:hypothetical protein